MATLYPLKFKTIFKDKIWGGEKIRTYLGKDFSPLPNCGETWEVSGVKSDVSVVQNVRRRHSVSHVGPVSRLLQLEIHKGGD